MYRLLPLAGVPLLLAGCAPRTTTERSLPGGWTAPPLPARPAACAEVRPGESLQARVDETAPGAALCLAPGRHAGPLVLRRPVTIWGPREAVVAAGRDGTTIRVDAPFVRLLGFTVDGSGARFDQLDAAVRVGSDDAVVEGLHVRNAVFGILCEKANRATVRGNFVEGAGKGPLGLRGDCIRLWETRQSVVERNHVVGGRDIVVWYSPGNRVAGNLVERSRYGTHTMYSHDSFVEDNLYVDDVVGVFVMYSRNVTLRRNVMARSTGAAGVGIGLKESGNVTVEDNLVVRDTTGIYVDTSPLNLGDRNVFERNSVRLCGSGVVFHSSPHRNDFVDNVFRDNQSHVRVQGGGHARDLRWEGNDFDTYQGYDLDRDGFGDVPFEMRSLSDELQDRHAELAFFHGSPTLSLLDAVSHAFPLFEPQVVLRDERPRLGVPEAAHAH